RRNMVYQSTGYTCAAAACATFLRRTGIDPVATERQMVPLVMTRRWGGATTLGMAVGLRHVAEPKGWRVKIVECSWDELIKLKPPVVCAIKHTALTDHAVVFCRYSEQRGVRIADPLRGMMWLSASEFERDFQGDAVVVYQPE